MSVPRRYFVDGWSRESAGFPLYGWWGASHGAKMALITNRDKTARPNITSLRCKNTRLKRRNSLMRGGASWNCVTLAFPSVMMESLLVVTYPRIKPAIGNIDN